MGSSKNFDFSAGLPLNPGTLSLAGFWRRVIAFCIDANCILLIRCGLSVLWALALSGYTENMLQHFHLLIIIFSTIGYIVTSALTGLLYYAGFECSAYRATPGKLVMQAFVADLHGAPISFSRSVGRNSAKALSALLFGTGFLMAAFTARKQALHDVIAGTTVLKHSNPPPARFVLGILLAVGSGLVAQGLSERAERTIHELRSEFEAQQGDGLDSHESRSLDSNSDTESPDDERFDDADGKGSSSLPAAPSGHTSI